MQVTYCDLCGLPIKHMQFNLIIAEFRSCPIANFNTEADENAYYQHKRFEKELEKEVCETCKHIIDQIFEKRMIGVLKLANDLKTIYNQPVKIKKKDKG